MEECPFLLMNPMQKLEWETQQKELLAREKKEFQKRLKEKQEKLVEAEEVHHKKKLSDGGTHDRDNLIALCKSCHSKIHVQNREMEEGGHY